MPNDLNPDSAPLSYDLPCVACGYNLRTLPPTDACPECGTPIAKSIHGNLLRDANPQWVRRIARGIGMVLIGTLPSLCRPGTDPMDASLYIGAVGAAIVMLGYWSITRPEPNALAPEPALGLRRGALLLGVASLVMTLSALCLGPMAQGAIWHSRMQDWLSSADGIAGLAAGIALLAYVRRLARRLPDPRTVRALRVTIWVLALAPVVIAASSTLAYFLNGIGGVSMGFAMHAEEPVGRSSGVVALFHLARWVGFGAMVAWYGAALWSLVLLAQFAARLAKTVAHGKSDAPV